MSIEGMPEPISQIYETHDVGKTIDQDKIREETRILNAYGEQDTEQVEKALFEQEAKAATEKLINENKEISFLVPTFFYKLMAEDREGYYVAKPIRLPALEKGTLSLEAFGDKSKAQEIGVDTKVVMTIDERGLTIPGYVKNPNYIEGVSPITERPYIEGEFSYPFPSEGESSPEIVIGRNINTCDVQVSLDPNMSRRHLRITLHSDHSIEILDISSNQSSIQVKGEKTRDQTIKDLLRPQETTIQSQKDIDIKEEATI